ncbi:MAG: hypothetical protein OXG44_01505 [Gammaproteobacteria bacterium]|nr:hypothetical protein [Gammaproteobacteria bacterium]
MRQYHDYYQPEELAVCPECDCDTLEVQSDESVCQNEECGYSDSRWDNDPRI